MKALISVLAFIVGGCLIAKGEEPETFLTAVQTREVSLTTSARAWPDGDYINMTGLPSVVRTLTRQPDGSFWRWSQARPHHAAAVRVTGRSGAGSGVIIKTNNGTCVAVTNHHVIRGNSGLAISWPNGPKCAASVVMHSARLDVALLHIPRPPANFFGLPLSNQDPPIGTELELLGFGGPKYGTKRTFWAKRVQPRDGWRLQIDAPTISGDSGSGICWNGHVVGVNMGGPGGGPGQPLPSYRGVDLVWPASSYVEPKTLSDFVVRACQSCPGGGCQPQYGSPSSGFYNPPGAGQPPATIPGVPTQPQIPQIPLQPIPSQPSQPQPGQTPRYVMPIQQIDIDDLKAEILAELLAKMPEGKEGRPGRDGERGRDGQQGPPGQPGQVDIGAVASDAAALVIAHLPETPILINGNQKGTLRIGQPLDLQIDYTPGQLASLSPEAESAIAARIAATMKQRVMIVDGSTKTVLDDETYENGEPIVIDFQRVINAR